MDVIRQLETEIHGSNRREEVGRRDIGVFAEVFGVDLKEKLGHDGICGHHQMGNLLFFNTSHGHQIVDYFIEILDDLPV